MNVVEQVALWVGLLVGVISVSLAIVSIVFTLHVDRRSGDVNDKTLASLENIKTTGAETQQIVADLSSRVIDRLFGMAERGQSYAVVGEDVAAGLAAELRRSLKEQLGVDRIPELEEMVERLRDDVQDILLDSSFADDRDAAFHHAVAQLKSCTPESQELARRLSKGRHLDEVEFSKLLHPSHGGIVGELRSKGLLIPLVPEWSSQELVYWFPPNIEPVIEAAVATMPPARPAVRREIAKLLHAVGYEVPDFEP